MNHSNSSLAYIVSDHINNTTDTANPENDELLRIFELINYVIIGLAVNIFGTITNITNIIVFVKLGFSDPVNVSFLGLAISDFASCLSLVWLYICLNPLFQSLDIPFDPDQIHYLTASWPHAAFVRITSCITAFITLERCLCVLFPLKVKNMITPKKAFVFLVCTYLFVFASVAPVYYANSFAWTFDEILNRSIIRLAFREDKDQIEAVSLTIVSGVLPITVFTIVIICTILLVVTLRRKAKWRQASSTGSDVSSRDTKVSKMIVFVSTLFIVCFFPILFLYVGMVGIEGFSVVGKHKKVFYITYSMSFLLETTNASLNIFIYHKMSSNYRETFNGMFGIRSKRK